MNAKDDKKIFEPKTIEDHVDPLRSMMAEGHGQSYRSYKTLAEAVANDGHVVMQGDYGGQIYLTCPAKSIKCTEPGLKRLLDYLDIRSWNDAEGANLFFEDHAGTTRVAGGMGGGLAIDDIWLHPRLQQLGIEFNVRSFLSGLTDEL